MKEKSFGEALIYALLVIAIRITIVWLVWNMALTDIFSINPISFWQAWGLVLICGALFHREHTK